MPKTRGVVVVLASFMMDLVAKAPRRPRTGESLVGTDFGMYVGGKGNNQAIAAARCGASVRVIGRLGNDLFAQPFTDVLDREGIDATWISRDHEVGTGVALPLIEPDGQNSIVAIPRANSRMSADDVVAAAKAFDGADVLLAQFEVALPAVWAAIELAHTRGLYVVLTPAPLPDPVPPLAPEKLALVDVLVPNEREAEALTGVPTADMAGAERAARALLASGCRSVVVTLGHRGALWVTGRDADSVHIPPYSVEQVDATAAGDAFCGVLAAALAAGLDTPQALRRASAAGALAVTRQGAEPSLPATAEVERFLRACDDA